MKFATWAVHVVSIVSLSVSAEAQNALRGLGRYDVADKTFSFTDRMDRMDQTFSKPKKDGDRLKRDWRSHLGGPRGKLSDTGTTDVILEVQQEGLMSARDKCLELAEKNGGFVRHGFSRVGSCVIRLPNEKIKDFGKQRWVKKYEVDMEVSVSTDTLPDNEPWGLDRIDQCHLPMPGDYQPMDAAGTKVYILDTGIAPNPRLYVDPDCSIDTSGDGGTGMTDSHGHGTHVAGTTCGREVGVAWNCKLCAVQVLRSSGSGSTSGVIAGINHVIENCKDGEKCIANMSLGGGFSGQLNAAVALAVNSGITVVVAAGNANQDACNVSPASETKAITVGSIERGDKASYFSNYGSCVDVFAPGSDIWSTSKDGQLTSKSGTSMASPHVAGLAAGIAGEYGISEPEAMFTKINDMVKILESTHGNGDPLRLVTNVGGCQGPTPIPAPSCTSVTVKVTTDDYGYETTWELIDDCAGGVQVWRSGERYGNNQELTETKCIPTSKFTFTIHDEFGDGICCGYGKGSYKVLVDNEIKAEGGEFGASKSHDIGGDCASPPTY